MSEMSDSINVICKCYNLSKYHLLGGCVTSNDNCYEIIASVIKDFMSVRDSVTSNEQDVINANHIINELCN